MPNLEINKNQVIPFINILGIKINNIPKEIALQVIKEYISKARKTGICKYITTPYSEFFVEAYKKPELKKLLNNSLLNLPDGVFTQWASYFNKRAAEIGDHWRRNQHPWKKGFCKTLRLIALYVETGASIVFAPSKVHSVIAERIPGSTFIYDLCKLASQNNFKVAILGGFDFGQGNTGILAAEKLKQLYPTLVITEIYPGNREKEEFGETVVELLRKSKADILFCCYGPIRQEIWLAQNLQKTGIAVGIGLGGTLDYVSGMKKAPPKLISKLGLEWFFRPLFAEGLHPKRFFKRLLRAWPAMIKSSLIVLREAIKNTT